MATPAQKHFKEEMRKLGRDGHSSAQESIYHPYKRRRKDRPWWMYSIIGILLFLVMFSTIPVKVYNDYIVSKHDRMVSYLKAHKEYTEQSDITLNSILLQSSQPASLDLATLQQSKATLNQLLRDSEQVKVPAAFKSHKVAFIELMEKRLFIITYIELLAKTNSSNTGELTPHINELNVKKQMERDLLLGVFNKEKIKYTIEADGSIRYEFKTYTPGKYN